MQPFPGSVDDWPGRRAEWLDVVWSLLEQVRSEKEPDPERDAAMDAALADAKRKAGQG